MSCRRRHPILALVCLSAGLALPGSADAAQAKSDSRAVAGLRAALGADAKISVHPATGVARFVSLPAGRAGSLSPAAAGTPEQKAAAFFAAQAGAFGIRDAAGELVLRDRRTDPTGMTHLDYAQVYAGVPVFAGELKAHFDRAGALRTVNGVFVPGINVNPTPTLSAADAGEVARAAVVSQKQPETAPAVKASRLYVYRAGLAKGVSGPSHLVYEVEVANQRDVREFVYVDAHTGRIVDQVTGIHEALNRRVHNQTYGNVVWQEGDPLPHPNVDINNIITFTGQTYNMFSSTFGRDSYDGAGHMMESVNDDPAIACPNANWNGTTTNYCTGVTGDDTVAHEWGHAYTEFTHGLIYAWQPGALNESYSDIWGEVLDTVNGPNTPDAARAAGACSLFGGTPPPTLTITGGPAAGTYFATASVNEPTPPFTIGPTAMAISNPPGACTPVTGVSGRIAIIDWTLNSAGGNECGSVVRATNALNAGATGIIFVASEVLGLLNLGSINTIASVQVTHDDGTTIKAGLPADATITLDVGTDNTYRWLSGEDDPSFGGAIRDMWNPNCFGDPARVTPGFYTCGTGDGGGVHTNSGVPNHAFALLVDGGTYNGQTVTGIGMTRAAHIYFRAMTVYQHPATDFPDHADSLEESCDDLIGMPLNDLFGGPPVTINAAHCTEVADTMLATGMRTEPTFCNFQPILNPNTPPACPAGSTQNSIFSADFESNPFPTWTATHVGSTPDFTPRDWVWSNALPVGEPGSALFGPDPINGTCAPGGDESGILSVTSPAFVVPTGAVPRLSFRHWIATELDFDGAHLLISVNGGPFTQVAPQDFTFNPYNGALVVAQNTNPYAGQPAFHGSDPGSVLGSWGTSHVNLAPYAPAGASVRLRFDMSTDGCNGNVGWYVDNVNVFHCSGAGAHSLSVADAGVVEGNAGPVQVTANVTLSAPDTVPITVNFATADGLATTANNDYTAVTGTLTFSPGQTSRAVTVSVIGDTALEPPENFFVNLSNPVGSTINDGQGAVTIINDDGGTGIGETKSELSHGYRTVRALNNTTNSNMFWIQTQAASSYEVVVDASSGDINAPAGGPDVQRLSADGSSVIGTATPVGTGPARSLRWQTSTAGAVNLVRVRSADCTTNCGADDNYRLRAYETTYTIPRFNNTGSQVTVLLLQNPTSQSVNATVYFYNGGGTELTSQTMVLAPKALQIVNTASIPQANGQSGTLVVTHDAPYGSLAGKTVALEPSTGFSFDSPMQPRNR